MHVRDFARQPRRNPRFRRGSSNGDACLPPVRGTDDAFALVTKKSVLSKIDLSKTTTSLVGDLAIVRCHFSGTSESSGKPVPTEIEVLLIWQKRSGDWKLLARQAYKI